MVGVGFRPICDGKMNVNYVKKSVSREQQKNGNHRLLLLYAFMMLLTLALLHESSSHLRYFMRCWSSSKVSHEFQIRFLSISRQRSSRDKKNLQCRYFSHTKKTENHHIRRRQMFKKCFGREKKQTRINFACTIVSETLLQNLPGICPKQLRNYLRVWLTTSAKECKALSLCLRAVIYDKTDLFRGGSRRKAMNGEAERENQHI